MKAVDGAYNYCYMRGSMKGTRFRSQRAERQQLAAEEEALSACCKIAILGKLLAAARSDIQGQLELEVVVQSGEMIAAEAERLRELIRGFRGLSSEG